MSACQHAETQYFGDGVYRCAECGDMVDRPKIAFAPAADSRDTAAPPLSAEERRLKLIESRHLVQSQPRDFRGKASVEVTWAEDLLRYEATVVSLEAQIIALTARAVRAEADAKRLDYLWRSLPFEMRHRYGGDEREARQGIDAAMAAAPRPATP